MASNDGIGLDATTPTASVPIHRSAFFVPSILETLSRAKLNDARFPHRQLDELMAVAYDDARIRSSDHVLQLASTSSVTVDEQTALKEAVQAIGAQVAAAPTQGQATITLAEQRILLGFCLVLARQYVQGAMELDVARAQVFARLKKATKESKGCGVSAAEMTKLQGLQIMLLWGLELAASCQGKNNDTTRFRTWRQKAQAEARGEVATLQ